MTCIALAAALAAGGSPRSTLAVDLLRENFDQLALQKVKTFQSEVRSRAAWTMTPPSGPGVQGTWSIDNSLMPQWAMTSDLVGVAEFEGWSFVDRDWWIETSGDQGRSKFVSASGIIAVADPDEWDDFGNPVPEPPTPGREGHFDSTLRISNIPLQGIAPNTARLFFHSSWLPENTQKASLTVKYNDPTATSRLLLDWTSSEQDGPRFHKASENEAINLDLLNPAGATAATLEFRLYDARNDWWWAIDNVAMFTGAAPSQDGALRLVINRQTQSVRIVNNTSGPINLRGYSIESRAGTLNESVATYLGISNPNWQVLDNPISSELSEGYIPDQYVMPTLASNPTLGQINLGPAWRKYHEDITDITFKYLVAGKATPQIGIIEFEGGDAYDPLDLNFDRQITLSDYQAFLAGYNTSLAGKTPAQKYVLGDLDGDGKHTVNDFLAFKREFDQRRGTGAFAAALASGGVVPEPTTALLAVVTIGAIVAVRRRRGVAAVAALGIASGAMMNSANAGLPLLLENFESLPLGSNPDPEDGRVQSGVWTDVAPAGWTVDRSGVPGYSTGDPDLDGSKDFAGWVFVKKDWWIATAGNQNRSQFTRGTGTVMVADPDEWDDLPHLETSYYNTFITTPVITIPAGVPAGKIRLAFDSSWRPEGFDDYPIPPATTPTNNQTATVAVRYNGGAYQNLLTWDSQTGGPNFHPDSTNEAIDLDLNYNGTATTLQLQFGLTKAANDWWWALDNIRVVVPSAPTILQINTTTGSATIVGGDVISETINGYDISSALGNLSPTGNVGLSFSKPNPVDGPDGDSIVGNSLGENWQLASSNSNLFSEFFLDGSSTFVSTRSESLGKIFNPATPIANRDVKFTYSTTFGDVVEGVVQYVATPENADFDSDLDVDGNDFLRWQRGVGVGTTLAQGDADGNQVVNGADLAIWKSKYGLPVATPAGAAVPEPSALLMAPFGLACLAARRSTRRRRKLVAATAVATLALGAAQARAQAVPAPFVDRDYRMGDNDPGAANGAAVTITRDNAGEPGKNQLIDMTAQTRGGGPPTYVTISGRPGGGTGLGIRLNPNPTDRQYLRTGMDEALNFPERSPSSIDGTLAGGTLDYRFITDRGFQLWVQPFANNEAHIVMDSNNHGALVTPAGKFGMRYSGFDYSGVTSVVPSTWYHLMVVRAFGDRGSGSVLYVNGIAEAAAIGIYNGENAPNDEANPVNHDNSPLVVGSTTSESPFQVGTQKYFRGVVDDLKMFVIGLNNTADYGEFVFQRDNDYAHAFGPTMDGDLNNDHAITIADVTTFAANWRVENRLTWMQNGVQQSLVVGDLTSRAKGDFNYDGRVDLADWGILNAVNPAMGAAAMRLIQSVPEPAAAVLAAMAVVAAARVRQRRARGGRKASFDLRSA